MPVASPPPNALTPGRTLLVSLFPHRMPAFRLGSKRRDSTSRSALTRPRSRTCTPCSTCALHVPWPHSLESGPPRACRLRCRPSALIPPGPYLFSHRMPAFRLGSTHRRSASCSALTRPRVRKCTPCSLCALRVPWPPALSQAISVHAACAAIAPRPLTPHRTFPPFDSAGDRGGGAHLVGVGKLPASVDPT